MSRSPSSVTTNTQFGSRPGIHAWGWVAGFAAALAASACLNFDPFGCQDDGQCDTEAMGVCQPVGYCSYPDEACIDTGYRFEGNAGDGLGGECVVPMASTGTVNPSTEATDSSPDTEEGTGPTTGPDPDSSSDDGPTTGDVCGGGGQACCPEDACDDGLVCNEGLCSCVQAVAVGDRHSCAIKLDGSVWCWGDNAQGQLAAPPEMTPSSSEPLPIDGFAGTAQVIAARNHTCVVGADSIPVCWGDNAANKVTPLDAAPAIVIPVAGNAWDAAMIGPLGVGGTHTCVGVADLPPLCWGSNAAGQLGSPEPIPPLPVSVNGVEPTAIALGESHSCMSNVSGQLFCWGSNASGQLGIDPALAPTSAIPQLLGTLDPITQVVSGQHHVCIRNSAEVLCWGHNDQGQLGIGNQLNTFTPTPVTFPPPAGNVASLVAAADQTCAVMATGDLYCWGGNQNGELLLEPDKTGQDGFTTTPQAIDLEFAVAQLATGVTHTCALTGQGQVMCWGRNSQGQIGDGTMANALQPTPVLLSCP